MNLKFYSLRLTHLLPQPNLTRLPEKDGAANTDSPVCMSLMLSGKENASSGNWLMHLISKILVTRENY